MVKMCKEWEYLEKDRPKPEDYDIDIEKELENKFDELFGSLEWGNLWKKEMG